MRYAIHAVVVGALLAFVVGCTKGPSGKYSGAAGMASLEFKDGKVVLSDASGHSETDDYSVDGNTVTIKSAAGEVKYTIMQDGSLEGPLGTFKKAAS